MMDSASKPILLVEDNSDDAFFMKRALKDARIALPLHHASDGQEAIDYLSGTGKFQDRTKYPLPSYVFLDLKLPYKSGFEVFSWMRDRPELRNSVVVILTSSPEPRDRGMAAQLGAHAYLVKPPVPQALSEILNLAKDGPSC